MIGATAPGKVVLSGEYAVLDGAPAVCVAVDRRARAAVTPSPGERHRVVAPGYSDIEGRFTAASGRLRWQQGGEEYALVDALWRVMQPQIDSSLTLMLDTSDFREPTTGAKTGIGSSAALVTALAIVLNELSTEEHDLPGVAYEAHSDFQDGRGSGIDVACAVSGGLVEYCMAGRTISSLEWPDGLHHALLWSGMPMSTGDALSRLQRAVSRSSREHLVAASRQVAAAWRGASVDDLLGAYGEYVLALRRFSDDHEIGIFAAGHDEVATAAAGSGLVYKPCGAGGGDVGIVLGSDAGAVEEFAERSIGFGFRRLDAGIGATGARMEQL